MSATKKQRPVTKLCQRLRDETGLDWLDRPKRVGDQVCLSRSAIAMSRDRQRWYAVEELVPSHWAGYCELTRVAQGSLGNVIQAIKRREQTS